jgi:16S rRNA (guanine(1405)-N(7))-methyltransferase
MKVDPTQLDWVAAEIVKNASYARMDVELVRKIAWQEMEKRKTAKEAVKAARSKLHQIGLVYLESPKPVIADFSTIAQDQIHDRAYQKKWVTPYLNQHVSTKERQTFIQVFYEAIFQQLPPVKAVLDLACGLNPLCRPWMPLAAEVPYIGLDIFGDVITLVNTFFQRFGYAGQAALRDVTLDLQADAHQVIFLLKTLPCLEQIEKGIGKKIMAQFKSNPMVVSFPAKSLGGRNIGMVAHYEAYLQSILGSNQELQAALSFSNETVYILKGKSPDE